MDWERFQPETLRPVMISTADENSSWKRTLQPLVTRRRTISLRILLSDLWALPAMASEFFSDNPKKQIGKLMMALVEYNVVRSAAHPQGTLHWSWLS